METATRIASFVNALAPSLLTPEERVSLAWACGALFPRLEPATDRDDAALFAADAITLGVPAAIEEALTAVPAEQLADFRRLLRAFDSRLGMLTLAGTPHPLRTLAAPERERALLSMSTSRLPQARRGFQAIKRLASFLFYSLMDDNRRNPTWPAMGYEPSANLPPRGPALQLTAIDGPTTLECDVCVVGSGAGGGVAVAELAAAGLRVVVLEQGPGDQAGDFDQREVVGMQRLYLDRCTTSSRDLGLAILAGACVGGGTTVNWQTSLRPPDEVREEWSARSGLRLFTEESFSYSLDVVSERVGVGTAESVVNANNDALRRGCTALGWRWASIPRNARGCDPGQCGFCVFGCRHGGKQSTSVTFLADAQQGGDVTIVPNCRAVRVRHTRGSVSGVHAVARDPRSAMGTEFAVDVRCQTVVLAAGAIETPALMMRSGIEHAALGHHLYLHPTSAVAGVYPKPVHTWDGPPQTVMSAEHAAMNSGYGVRLETAPGHPGLLSLALPWWGARDHRERMQRAGHVSAIIALTRDRAPGRVRVDRSGRAIIEYRPGAEELEHLRRGIAAAVRVHVAAGAEEVVTLHSRQHVLDAKKASSRELDAFCEQLSRDALDRNWSTLFSAHQMGTCRMGRDAHASVCDEDGRVNGTSGLHVCDASLFPASTGVNPMITVMAVAHHVAKAVVREAGGGRREGGGALR